MLFILEPRCKQYTVTMRSCMTMLMFCQFFVNKVKTTSRKHCNRQLTASLPSDHIIDWRDVTFHPLMDNKLWCLLASMPSKSSPLDVLPYSLLKTCTDVFVPVTARLACLLLQSGTHFHPPVNKPRFCHSCRILDLTLTHQQTADWYQQLSVIPEVLERLALHAGVITSSVPSLTVSSSRLIGTVTVLKLHFWKSFTVCTGWRQTDHCSCWSQFVGSLVKEIL